MERQAPNTCGVMVTANEIPFDEIRARLKEALEHRKINRSELARRSKIRAGTITALLNGPGEPSLGTLYVVCMMLKVYPSYILLGLGPKYMDETPAEVDGQPQAHGVDQWLAQHPELDEDERAWLRAVPWPVAHVKQPDLIYIAVLSAYRESRAAKPAPKPALRART